MYRKLLGLRLALTFGVPTVFVQLLHRLRL